MHRGAPRATSVELRYHDESMRFFRLVSTFFTLILIPTLYVMFEKRFPRRK